MAAVYSLYKQARVWCNNRGIPTIVMLLSLLVLLVSVLSLISMFISFVSSSNLIAIFRKNVLLSYYPHDLLIHPWTALLHPFYVKGALAVLFALFTFFLSVRIFLCAFSEQQAMGLFVWSSLISACFLLMFGYGRLLFQGSISYDLYSGPYAATIALLSAVRHRCPQLQIFIFRRAPLSLRKFFFICIGIAVIVCAIRLDPAACAVLVGGWASGLLFEGGLRRGTDITQFLLVFASWLRLSERIPNRISAIHLDATLFQPLGRY